MKKKFKFYCIFQKHYIEFLISLLKFQKKINLFKVLILRLLFVVCVKKLLTKCLEKII